MGEVGLYAATGRHLSGAALRIQWITKDHSARRRQETFFAAVTEDDLARERKVEAIVANNLAQWQSEGLVPDMPIEPGEKTTSQSAHAAGRTGITCLRHGNCLFWRLAMKASEQTA